MVKQSQEGFIDACFESKARNVTERTEYVRKKPTDENVRLLARAIQALNIELSPHRLGFYGNEYREKGGRFVHVAQDAIEAASLVPETITNDEPGADHSAHDLIRRSARELTQTVLQTCGEKIAT